MEMKVILALTVRESHMRNAYDEWDELYLRKGMKTFEGERGMRTPMTGSFVEFCLRDSLVPECSYGD